MRMKALDFGDILFSMWQIQNRSLDTRYIFPSNDALQSDYKVEGLSLSVSFGLAQTIGIGCCLDYRKHCLNLSS